MFCPNNDTLRLFSRKKIYTCVGLAKPFSLSGLSKKHKYYYRTQGFSINQKDGRVDTFTILFVIV